MATKYNWPYQISPEEVRSHASLSLQTEIEFEMKLGIKKFDRYPKITPAFLMNHSGHDH